MGYNLLINGIKYSILGVIIHLLTIDPNFQRDIPSYQWSKVWVQSDERARLQQLQQRTSAVVDASLGQRMKLDFEAPGGDFVEVIDVATGPDRFGFQLFQRFFSGWLRSLRLANPDWWPSVFFFFFDECFGVENPPKIKMHVQIFKQMNDR